MSTSTGGKSSCPEINQSGDIPVACDIARAALTVTLMVPVEALFTHEGERLTRLAKAFSSPLIRPKILRRIAIVVFDWFFMSRAKIITPTTHNASTQMCIVFKISIADSRSVRHICVVSTEQQHHDKELITAAEAARYLKQKTQTVWSHCRSGRLPHIRLSKAIRIRRGDLEKFLQASTR